MFAPESLGEPEGGAEGDKGRCAGRSFPPDEGDIPVETEVAEGPACWVGSRGFGGFRELLLGSVSQQCAHHSTRPVVVVRHYPQEERLAS